MYVCTEYICVTRGMECNIHALVYYSCLMFTSHSQSFLLQSDPMASRSASSSVSSSASSEALVSFES
jgi:hypothetical protein